MKVVRILSSRCSGERLPVCKFACSSVATSTWQEGASVSANRVLLTAALRTCTVVQNKEAKSTSQMNVQATANRHVAGGERAVAVTASSSPASIDLAFGACAAHWVLSRPSPV
eukprot:6195063-Prymnesium_polylepis.1